MRPAHVLCVVAVCAAVAARSLSSQRQDSKHRMHDGAMLSEHDLTELILPLLNSLQSGTHARTSPTYDNKDHKLEIMSLSRKAKTQKPPPLIILASEIPTKRRQTKTTQFDGNPKNLLVRVPSRKSTSRQDAKKFPIYAIKEDNVRKHGNKQILVKIDSDESADDSDDTEGYLENSEYDSDRSDETHESDEVQNKKHASHGKTKQASSEHESNELKQAYETFNRKTKKPIAKQSVTENDSEKSDNSIEASDVQNKDEQHTKVKQSIIENDSNESVEFYEEDDSYKSSNRQIKKHERLAEAKQNVTENDSVESNNSIQYSNMQSEDGQQAKAKQSVPENDSYDESDKDDESIQSDNYGHQTKVKQYETENDSDEFDDLKESSNMPNYEQEQQEKAKQSVIENGSYESDDSDDTNSSKTYTQQETKQHSLNNNSIESFEVDVHDAHEFSNTQNQKNGRQTQPKQSDSVIKYDMEESKVLNPNQISIRNNEKHAKQGVTEIESVETEELIEAEESSNSQSKKHGRQAKSKYSQADHDSNEPDKSQVSHETSIDKHKRYSTSVAQRPAEIKKHARDYSIISDNNNISATDTSSNGQDDPHSWGRYTIQFNVDSEEHWKLVQGVLEILSNNSNTKRATNQGRESSISRLHEILDSSNDEGHTHNAYKLFFNFNK